MVTLLDTVLKPIEYANGLPNAHYISPDMYNRERDQIFFKNWSAIAFESDAPKPGDVFPVDFMGMPLLLVRTKDNVLNVFQNTCRHRGMILVDTSCHLKGPIRCPYHSWSYSHDGDLLRTPHIGGLNTDTHDAVDRDNLGLFKIRSHIWQGVVFVDISGQAPAFDTEHADLIERWKAFDQPYFIGGSVSQFDMTLATNWKLAVENYCESYHLPWIHPELNAISPLDVHYNIDTMQTCSGQRSANYNQLVGDDGLRFPDFAGLSDVWNTQSEYISLFPNVLLGVHRDHAFAMILMPQGPEETLERVALCYARPDIDTPRWHAMLERNAEIWRGVFNEDIRVVEGMQRGRHGPLFDGGTFSPVMDVPTHIFHKWVAGKMRADG